MLNHNRGGEGGEKPPNPIRPKHPKVLAHPRRPIKTDGSHWPPFEGRRETTERAPPPPMGKGGQVTTNIGNLAFQAGKVRCTSNGAFDRHTQCHRPKEMKGKQLWRLAAQRQRARQDMQIQNHSRADTAAASPSPKCPRPPSSEQRFGAIDAQQVNGAKARKLRRARKISHGTKI